MMNRRLRTWPVFFSPSQFLRASLFFFSTVSLMTGCGTKSRPSQSDLSFAHYKSSSALGGPLGRLVAKAQGFETDFPKLRICAHQTVETKLSPQQLMFETRLAYAAWLDAAKLANTENWNSFEFFTGDCKAETSATGFVSLGLHQTEEVASFASPTIRCQSTPSGKRCNSTTITLGLGGPGSVSTWFRQSAPDIWTKITQARASSTWLSPHVSWNSLQSFLEGVVKKQPTDLDLAQLLELVTAAVATANPELAILIDINHRIAALGLTDGKDQVFEKASQDFFRGQQASLQLDYRPSYTAYHVMLHEIGHEFGMAHADDPSAGAVTGPSGSTVQGAGGQFTTDQSSMAYADPYFYLTEDDIAGIQSLHNQLEQLARSHRGP